MKYVSKDEILPVLLRFDQTFSPTTRNVSDFAKMRASLTCKRDKKKCTQRKVKMEPIQRCRTL